VSIARDSRQEKKVKALLRAQFSYKQKCERIDHEEDVVIPTIEAMKSGKSVLGLPEGVAFDIQVVREDSDYPKTRKAE
jgi:hypothetical protein